MATVEGLVRALDLAEQGGATYRQVEYWTRLGLLKPVDRTSNLKWQPTKVRGSGSTRWYEPGEVQKVRALAAISHLWKSGDLFATIGNAPGPWILQHNGVVVEVTLT
jgi:hypothetical protein